jgi:hypothetical protein
LAYFLHGKSDILILTRMGWATFWSIFSHGITGHAGDQFCPNKLFNRFRGQYELVPTSLARFLSLHWNRDKFKLQYHSGIV